jgi:excisionase family DNA binding protein
MSLSPAEIDRLAEAIVERLAGHVGHGPSDEVGDVHDVARWLGCSVPTIERAVARGEIPSIKVGRLRRYQRAAVLGLNAKGGCDHGK